MQIKLPENEEIIDDDTKIAEEVNNFFKKNRMAFSYIHINQYTVENIKVTLLIKQ